MIAGLKYGVGYIGVGDFKPKLGGKNTKAYDTWNDMFKRCYNPKVHAKHPTYIGCTVAEEWHNFQVFAEWFENQYRADGWQLDKDLIFEGNKTYSPETCTFVPRDLNLLLTDRRNERGNLPKGVALKNKKYQARINIEGVRQYLGVYSTPEEAFAVYKTAKEYNIKYMAEKYKFLIDPRVYNFLVNYEVKSL